MSKSSSRNHNDTQEDVQNMVSEKNVEQQSPGVKAHLLRHLEKRGRGETDNQVSAQDIASLEDFQHTLHKDNFFNNVVVALSTKTNHVRFPQESDKAGPDNEVSTRESLSSGLYPEDVKRKKQLLHIGQK